MFYLPDCFTRWFSRVVRFVVCSAGISVGGVAWDECGWSSDDGGGGGGRDDDERGSPLILARLPPHESEEAVVESAHTFSGCSFKGPLSNPSLLFAIFFQP